MHSILPENALLDPLISQVKPHNAVALAPESILAHSNMLPAILVPLAEECVLLVDDLVLGVDLSCVLMAHGSGERLEPTMDGLLFFASVVDRRLQHSINLVVEQELQFLWCE